MTTEFQELRDKLEVLNSTQQTTTDTNIKIQTLSVIKHLIQRYIENALRAGVEASKIKSDMDNLFCTIPQALGTWVINEVDDTSRKLSVESKKLVAPLVPMKYQKPLLFSKDTLYHASLCCEAISGPLQPEPLSFFRNKKPHHGLTQVSFSQSRDEITPYLIARQNNVVYAAFKSDMQISEWLGGASSFTEGALCNMFINLFKRSVLIAGIMKQCSQIPFRFFMDELINNRRIVLTGIPLLLHSTYCVLGMLL